jgi:proteasome lid subunit RPN8/RPN11
MGTVKHELVEADAPLYIRWGPDRSPFAIELKLDIVPRITAELYWAERLGIEVGGVLIGYFTNTVSPILRIDDFEMIPRGPNDGAIYMLDPNQRERFVQIHRAAAARDKTPVGFFRSHFRSGPMRPSLADRSLLSGELKRPIYTLLLIQAQEPHKANFFVATDGQLPSEASVDEFRFSEREFLGLPEVQVETSELERSIGRRRRSSETVQNVLVGLLLVIVLAAFCWWWVSERGFDSLRRLDFSSKPMNLVITPDGGLLRISWNHSASELSRASDATLAIADGGSRREVKLGADELKLGAIEYERISERVQVTMQLTSGGTVTSAQTVDWSAR